MPDIRGVYVKPLAVLVCISVLLKKHTLTTAEST